VVPEVLESEVVIDKDLQDKIGRIKCSQFSSPPTMITDRMKAGEETEKKGKAGSRARCAA
jgi:hypothetical protein